MHLNEYQTNAHRTVQKAHTEGTDEMVPILGLAGEVGELLNEYKKKLRDGDAHERFSERVVEELGDILWYVAETASQFELDLETVAERNLAKIKGRWGAEDGASTLFRSHAFDAGFPTEKQLPRKFVADFRRFEEGGVIKTKVFVNGDQMGDPLTDNAHMPDGYQFHDVFHLACAAVLGWSPVIRKHLNRKRRSDARVDEVEDGGRAIVTEEGISALVFAYACDHKSLEGVKSLDYDLLKAIRVMVSSFEVAVCTTGEWERTILMGYQVWQQVQESQGGRVELNLDARTIRYLGM